MSKVKEANMTMEEIVKAGTALVKAGRETLDSLEAFLQLFPASTSVQRPAAKQQVCSTDVEETHAEPKTEKKAPAPTATLEQVRGLLAEKACKGYRADVKALLTAHGAKQLSDITDPEELGTLMAEAEMIGNRE